MTPSTAPRVAVVGGGIAGLAAAHAVRTARPDVHVVVLEASAALGGKLRGSEVAGVVVDEGADSLLARVPDAVELARAVGLGDRLVPPATAGAGLWTRGRVRPLPTGTVLGVPADLRALARSGALPPADVARAALDLVLPGQPVEEDVAVGALVARRLGRGVVDRLVDPLLGGVYAGRADALSLHATVPQLARTAATTPSLVRAARAARPARPVEGPVFLGLVGGLGTLPPAVAAASGAEVRLGTTVRGLSRTPSGWRLELGSAASPEALDADAVVLAVPAAPAARLLRGVAPAAAAEVGVLDYASVALVTLVLDGPAPGTGSGYLVPAVEGRLTKAVTFTSRKWQHLAGGPAVVRASVGRVGEEASLQRDDADLVATVVRELERAVGPLPHVLGTRVTRWGGGLPQYAVGHLDRVRRARAALPPGLALAGAAVDGVGVPACAGSGRRAGEAVLAHVRPAGAGAE
ncbi:MAG TPA: protoporphyrinogen oxidase [Mycobacteriales bacterium]|nr:protoporphyrinogen oxidase [Mycobacteriales bacterium]